MCGKRFATLHEVRAAVLEWPCSYNCYCMYSTLHWTNRLEIQTDPKCTRYAAARRG
jgi:hypothetical protein